MKIDRRTVLKGIATAPMAAAIPAATVAQTVAPSLIPAAAALPEKYPWKWWAGSDEMLYESFDTREDAIAAAKEMEYPYVCEAKHQDWDLRINVDRLCEWWYDRNSDRQGEDGEFLEITDAESKDLEQRLNRAVQEWIEANKIKTQAWIFGQVRNDEYVEIEEEEIDNE